MYIKYDIIILFIIHMIHIQYDVPSSNRYIVNTDMRF